MLDFGLQGAEKLAILTEDGQVKVVVIIGNSNLPGGVDAHTNRVVGNACQETRGTL